ncbi:sterile alpha motif domain-containing protein 3 isoform X1 [Ixodes scapularis]
MQAVKEQIIAALPNLTSGEVESVLNKFMSLGVERPNDLNFLTEGDLASILKPIQARKLVAYLKPQNRLTESLQKKKDVVLKLMRLDKRTENEYTKLMEDIAKAGDNASPEAGCLALMILLVTWFGEERDCLILRKDPFLTAAEVEEELPLSPCIIALGDDLWTAHEYALSIDGRLMVQKIPDVPTAWAALFASHYCFNICYAEGLSSTLEFLQR